MNVERTLSIIKPDGIEKDLIGEIFRRFEGAKLRIVAAKMLKLSQEQANQFYFVHREKSFYADLVSYMTSGPVMVQVLEGEGAIEKNRLIMGTTDPAEADPGTIRSDFAESIERNIVHGSDGPLTAAEEIRFFFSEEDICLRRP